MIVISSKRLDLVFLVNVLCCFQLHIGLFVKGSSVQDTMKSFSSKENHSHSSSKNHSPHLNRKSLKLSVRNQSLGVTNEKLFEEVRTAAQNIWSKSLSKYLDSDYSNNAGVDTKNFILKQTVDDLDNESATHLTIQRLERIEALKSYFVQKQMSEDGTINGSRNLQNQGINPFVSFQNFSKILNQSILESVFGAALPMKLTNESILQHQILSSMASFNELYPPWENLTQDEQKAFLNLTLGSPQMYGLKGTYGLGAYYSTLLFVGVPGNGLTCLIILTNSYMRTAPNIFLFNIALADLVTLITVVPLEISTVFKAYPWRLGEFGCDMATMACELTTHVLILTMIAFSIERYFAICHPLKPSFQSSKRRTLRICIMIWILSLAPSVFWSSYSKEKFLFYSRSEPPKHEFSHFKSPGFVKVESSAMCMVSPRFVSTTMATMTIVTTTMLYLLPIMILPFIYSRIAKALKDSESYSRASGGSGSISRNRKTVVRMQMAVLICFLICWTPYHVQRIMFVFVTKTESWTPKLFETAEVLHLISGCCYFLSSTINPFLYSLLSKRFRRGFHDLKYKMITYLNMKVPFRTTSTHTSSRNQNGQIPMISLNKNKSLKFNTKQVQSKNTMQRHFGQPASWTANCDEDEWKARILEMPRIANESNQYCSLTTFQPIYNAQKVEFIWIETENATQKNESEASALPTRRLKPDCKYRVSFKSHNKPSTTLLVNSNYRKIDNVSRKIQRCRPMYDLRNIGESSTVLCLRTKSMNQSFKVKCNTAVDDEVLRNQKTFLSNSHSFRI